MYKSPVCSSPMNNTNYEPHTPINFRKELKEIINERNLFTAKNRKQVCSMLDSPLQPNKIDKRYQFRVEAILEILRTEITYINQLETLMQFFIIPLKGKGIINESAHKSVFGQIEMIYNLNSEFLKELENDLHNVATLILKMAPFFKIYSVYAFDYKNALLTLQQLTKKNPEFLKFLQETESRPEVQTKLNSLMIVPIQRIPRYKLLLEQVLLYTSPADNDFKILKESVKLIENTASHINSVIEDQEATQTLLNLQNSLVNRSPNIVKPSRKIIKEGCLNKVTRNGAQVERYCILMTDIFMYCKIIKQHAKNTLVENSLECCCIFPLKKCKIYELFPGNFKISCQGDGLLFCTKDLYLGQSWILSIKETIELFTKCRQTLRKESSKRKPMRRKDVKYFENDAVLSPYSRNSVDYEKIYYGKKKDDDTYNPSCFKLSAIRSNIFKYKSESILETDKELSKIEFSTSETQSKKIASKRNISQLSDRNAVQNPLDDYDQSYGFANRLSVTKSYFRTNNIDSTIPTSATRKDFEQIILDGLNRNLLETTSQNQTNAISNSGKENCSSHKMLKNKFTEDISNLPKKRVKFNDVPIQLSKSLKQDICYSKEINNKPAPFKFSSRIETNNSQNSLKNRIVNFFSRLF